jgi:hypothetical protein
MNEFFEQIDGQLYGSPRISSANLGLANEELKKISSGFNKKMAVSFAKEARESLIGSAVGFLFAVVINLLLLLFVYDGLREMFAVGFQWLLLLLEVLALVSVILSLISHFVNEKIIQNGTLLAVFIVRKETVIPHKPGFTEGGKLNPRDKFLRLEFVYPKDGDLMTRRMRISFSLAIREYRDLDNFFIVLDPKEKHFVPVELHQKN